ncbi:hypothetical protein HME9302_02528 [Alteripontixanthobacter maritimus]|uniref:Uncharacterized protein n=1 Tax=Alteripontixanthobacter maritimus TaxID=2161824 RepID=A0A369QDI5_9SPHN|nr:DUF5996 family protein [Alteripontixanthobacter maritimus]RDC61307.1 hypothetical protein HME9302_02528 [Alteripontixanthobacter maritimus]
MSEAIGTSTMPGRWPALDYAADKAVIETLHAYLQVIGKLPIRTMPWLNHGWHVAMRVVPGGFRTYPLPVGEHEVEVFFDMASGVVDAVSSSGQTGSLAVRNTNVAAFAADLAFMLDGMGVPIDTSGAPNEVQNPVDFANDTAPRVWDDAVASRIHAAFRSVDRIFEAFRTGFVGKSSPSHLFFGSMDLAITRFSGRTAPLHPGGVPALPDPVTREAYSHEVASAGFWLGGGGIEEAAFYGYGYPSPEGLSDRAVEPNTAYWHGDLGEFVLPYAAVREANDPDAVLMAFLQSSYDAVADLQNWDRDALDIPIGKIGEPRGLPNAR